jgi:hypothetical protein
MAAPDIRAPFPRSSFRPVLPVSRYGLRTFGASPVRQAELRLTRSFPNSSSRTRCGVAADKHRIWHCPGGLLSSLEVTKSCTSLLCFRICV